MNGDDPHGNERQSLQTRLLNAVKQCQVRFGGRTELATDIDSRVSCLCSAWEAVLQHGMKHSKKAMAALKQVSELPGLNKVTEMFGDMKIETEPVFWSYVKEHLTKHEAERFNHLKHINTDSGRGRAWLRASLNEHSLERYMHMLVESDEILSQHYESWAFMRDQEKSSMMPMMARGLDSILFAITVDNEELNSIRQAPATVITVNTGSGSAAPSKPEEELRPVIAGDTSPVVVKKKEKKKKKKTTHIVSFDGDEESDGYSPPKDTNLSDNYKLYFGSSELANTSPSNMPNEISEARDVVNVNEPVMNQSGLKTVTSESSLVRSVSRDPSIASGVSSGSADVGGSFTSADFDLSTEASTPIMVPLTPGGNPAETAMMPFTEEDTRLSRSNSSEISAYGGEDLQSAAFALLQAQRGYVNNHRTAGDGGNVAEEIKKDAMSTDDLKKAVVAMMVRKDEVEEQNKSLRMNLEQEMETSSTLRAEIEQMKHSFAAKQEKEQAKLQALQKENELLKHQLRKYVNAVQMLRTEGSKVNDNLGIHLDEPQPSIPPEKELTDYSHEAEQYEQKLIQVAEMHGELMEFNELLHRQLNAKEAMLRRLQQELVDLRGPLPHDVNYTDHSGDTDSLTMHSRTLINIWIPSAFLRGSKSDVHHVYQVYVRIRDEEWNIYKRYKEFAELQHQMKKKYPYVGKFEFPPKKAIGKKGAKVVESRRQIMQLFLRNLINYILQQDESLGSFACKQKLIEVVPFFSDKTPAKDKKKQKRKSDPQLSSSPPRPSPMPEEYSGL